MEKLGLPLRFPNCSPIADECTLYSVVWYLLYALFNSVPFNLTDTLHHDEANFSGLSPFLVVLVILVLKICWATGVHWGCHQERKETWPMQHSEQIKAFEMFVAQRIFSSPHPLSPTSFTHLHRGAKSGMGLDGSRAEPGSNNITTKLYTSVQIWMNLWAFSAVWILRGTSNSTGVYLSWFCSTFIEVWHSHCEFVKTALLWH